MAAERVAPTSQRSSGKDRFRRLMWLAVWLVAGQSMRLWFADPSFADPKTVVHDRRGS